MSLNFVLGIVKGYGVRFEAKRKAASKRYVRKQFHATRREQKVSSEQVRADLREIRYYYSRKDQLEDASHSIGSLPIKRLLEKYNCVIREAPLRLYDLYACLYLRGQTQEAIALELGYTPQYIRKLINELFVFFRKNISYQEDRYEQKA